MKKILLTGASLAMAATMLQAPVASAQSSIWDIIGGEPKIDKGARYRGSYRGDNDGLKELVAGSSCSWRSAALMRNANPEIDKILVTVTHAHWVFGQQVNDQIGEYVYCLTDSDLSRISTSRHGSQIKQTGRKITINDGGVVFIDNNIFQDLDQNSQALVLIKEATKKMFKWDAKEDELLQGQRQILKAVQELEQGLLDAESFEFALEILELPRLQLDKYLVTYSEYSRMIELGNKGYSITTEELIEMLRLRKRLIKRGLVLTTRYNNPHQDNPEYQYIHRSYYTHVFHPYRYTNRYDDIGETNHWVRSLATAINGIPGKVNKVIARILDEGNATALNTLIGEALLSDVKLSNELVHIINSGRKVNYLLNANPELTAHFGFRYQNEPSALYRVDELTDELHDHVDLAPRLVDMIRDGRINVAEWAVALRGIVPEYYMTRTVLDASKPADLEKLRILYGDDVLRDQLLNQFLSTMKDSDRSATNWDALTKLVTMDLDNKQVWERIMREAFAPVYDYAGVGGRKNVRVHAGVAAEDPARIVRALKNYAPASLRHPILRAELSKVDRVSTTVSGNFGLNQRKAQEVYGGRANWFKKRYRGILEAGW